MCGAKTILPLPPCHSSMVVQCAFWVYLQYLLNGLLSSIVSDVSTEPWSYKRKANWDDSPNMKLRLTTGYHIVDGSEIRDQLTS